jgi:hypothetical protein
LCGRHRFSKMRPKFGLRRLWVRVDVEAPTIRKGRALSATLIAALRG